LNETAQKEIVVDTHRNSIDILDDSLFYQPNNEELIRDLNEILEDELAEQYIDLSDSDLGFDHQPSYHRSSVVVNNETAKKEPIVPPKQHQKAPSKTQMSKVVPVKPVGPPDKTNKKAGLIKSLKGNVVKKKPGKKA
jgi:hypothetical protein